MSKEIKLINSKINLVSVVDDADYEVLSQCRWYTVYNKHRNHYYARNADKKYMHRLILNPPGYILVDHINHDTLDNQRSNLRLSTKAQNAHNSRIGADNTSGYKGVSFCKYTNKWRTNIVFNMKQKTIGRYNTPEEAHLAYITAARELFGEYACAG